MIKPLRILHVVTYVDDKNKFGGPATVALSLSERQVAEGHEVTILAVGSAAGVLSTARLRLFKARRLSPSLGFAGIFSPSMPWWLARNARSFDIVHVHLARDLVTLPSALILRAMGRPYIAQTHGMIDHSSNRLAGVLDALGTRRALRGAKTVAGLTKLEYEDVAGAARSELPFEVVGNGISSACNHGESPDQPSPDGPVLFVGRLHSRKRPRLFVEAAAQAHRLGTRNLFEIIGEDEGELGPTQRLIQELAAESFVSLRGGMAQPDVAARMRHASLLVVTTDRERFGMAILEAMSVGLPIICVDSSDLGRTIADRRAGEMSESAAAEIGAAIHSTLSDRERWALYSKNAAALVQSDFTLEQVTQKIMDIYRRALA